MAEYKKCYYSSEGNKQNRIVKTICDLYTKYKNYCIIRFRVIALIRTNLMFALVSDN